jgi:hypothetical protein
VSGNKQSDAKHDATNAPIIFEQFVSYVLEYCEQYHHTFYSFVRPEPDGRGLPNVPPPPFASQAPMDCWLLADGAMFLDQSYVPPYAWYLAGGPALRVDVEPTRTPPAVEKALLERGLKGKQIGIYRIVARKEIVDDVWTGKLPIALEVIEKETSFGKKVKFSRSDLSKESFLERLTFGAFVTILDPKLKSEGDDFWDNLTISRLGFFPADLNSKRFFRYIEIAHNLSGAAWDRRGIWNVSHSTVIETFSEKLTLLRGEALRSALAQKIQTSRPY